MLAQRCWLWDSDISTSRICCRVLADTTSRADHSLSLVTLPCSPSSFVRSFILSFFWSFVLSFFLSFIRFQIPCIRCWFYFYKAAPRPFVCSCVRSFVRSLVRLFFTFIASDTDSLQIVHDDQSCQLSQSIQIIIIINGIINKNVVVFRWCSLIKFIINWKTYFKLVEMKWNEMNRALGYLCAHIG